MANVKGVLKVLKANDYGFYSAKIDDTWYGLGTKKAPEGIVTGDTVEGEFELEKGKYKTITKAGLKKAAGPQYAPNADKPADSVTKVGTDWAAKDASIRYQSSRKDALAFLALPGVLEAVGVAKAKPADKLGIIESTLDRYTATFHDDVATFGAVTRVNAPAVNPAAPASDSDDDE